MNMKKALFFLLSACSIAVSAAPLETGVEVSGEYDTTTGIGFAEGIISNVANSYGDKGTISCQIQANRSYGTIGRCYAKLAESETEMNCFTVDPGQLQAISGLTDSSYLRFDVIGVSCTEIVVENGSQYGAKRKAIK